jgi:hypothetical protein
MRIEALTPLKIKRPAGDMLLTPGEPVEFSDDEGRRLLERAGDKVRAIEDPLHIGMLIEWESRLFYGVLTGAILEVTAQAVRVRHPLTEMDALIPREWVKIIDCATLG